MVLKLLDKALTLYFEKYADKGNQALERLIQILMIVRK